MAGNDVTVCFTRNENLLRKGAVWLAVEWGATEDCAWLSLCKAPQPAAHSATLTTLTFSFLQQNILYYT